MASIGRRSRATVRCGTNALPSGALPLLLAAARAPHGQAAQVRSRRQAEAPDRTASHSTEAWAGEGKQPAPAILAGKGVAARRDPWTSRRDEVVDSVLGDRGEEGERDVPLRGRAPAHVRPGLEETREVVQDRARGGVTATNIR